ncbi:RNA-binding ribosome biosynthesis protein MAK21 Ecym_7432 [Eremothecium cymbalariae DBVPG|uniref:CCAAT-binding factor domain-containing protein n=1 Tax=Eremothecium cymbalariae (strain CBS 270.75 / DBVPG 7215 / KCTC 17166 / NRRL Y-17582) TaxID=931890 RepID=G8JWN8_ERECY|nr:hypothetical protein Ecym_7432 [Eremothecium cymbalariae DBVPG\
MSLDISKLKEKVSAKLEGVKGKDGKRGKAGKQKDVMETMVKTGKDDGGSVRGGLSEELREEAFALGASEQDLVLVEGLSDDEQSELEFGDDGDGVEDPEFQGDFKALLKTMGFDKIRQAEHVEEKDASLSSDSNHDSEPDEEDAAEPDEEEFQETFNQQEKENTDMITDTHFVHSDKLAVPCDVAWYDIPLDLAIEQEYHPLTAEQMQKLYVRGKEALEADNTVYFEEFTNNSSQRKFMSQILTDGTLNDKISALTLLIQESPLHNIKSMDMMLGFCNKKSRNSALQALNALKDLFLSGLLPDRKLKYFKNQPLSMLLSKRTLAILYFEDYLKQAFFKMLETLEKLTHDPLIHVRTQVLTTIFDLLAAKPEQEFNLLRLGCNKLGDIDNKVSSKASYQLLKLEQAHPNMKAIIVNAVIDVALKPSASYHGTYYSVLTLNQTILKKSESQLANHLIKSYFTLFEKYLIRTDPENKEVNGDQSIQSVKSHEERRKKNFKKGKNGGRSIKHTETENDLVAEKNTKLFSAILTGLNRAFPFASMSPQVYEEHLETLFKITHSSNFNTSVQALVLIYQVITKASVNPDRYYRTLYESLLDSRLANSSKQAIYLNLLYKSLKNDTDVARVDAFMKRIMQVCLNWLNIGAVSGMLYLLLQLLQHIPQSRNLLLNTPVDHEYLSDTDKTPTENADITNNTKHNNTYDPRKRDPKHANAQSTSLWETTHFLNHYHPTVNAYANSLCTNSPLAKPDLALYSLAHFLDRFVYRNAKQKPVTRGSSIMQPLSCAYTGSLLVRSSDSPVHHALPPNTEDWLSKKVSEIRPDEHFFYHYFTTKSSAVRTTTSKDTRNNTHFDVNDDDDLDENDVWDALVKSRPDVEGETDSDSENDLLSDTWSSEEEESHLSFSSIEDTENETDNNDDDNNNKNNTEHHQSSNLDVVTDADADTDADRFKSARVHALPEGNKKDSKHKNKRQKPNTMRDLPTFAAVEDYAQYLSETDTD